jgi:hypothetical protein
MDLDHKSPPGAHADATLPIACQVFWVLSMLDELKPNIVIDTGWGRQVHWLLSCDVTPDQRQGLLLALAEKMMTIASKLAVPLKIERLDLAGMFRVPGSRNVKIAPIRPVEIMKWTEGPGFTPEYLAKRCPHIAAPSLGAGGRHVPGPVTAKQEPLLAHLIEHHGAHGLADPATGRSE